MQRRGFGLGCGGVLALAVALLGFSARAQAQALSHWPRPAAETLEASIRDAPKGSYAVFDADNTIWRNDLEEALLPYMEAKGLLSPAKLPPVLRPTPLLKGESLYGYYQRLCEIDDKVCYPWIAQVFSGFTLGQLKVQVDAMMASGRPIPVVYREGGRVVRGAVSPPAIYPGQRELIRMLMAGGIDVYVVTAASEELARMVVSDPKYGLGVKPDHVVGVTLILRDPKTGALTTARKQIAEGHFLDETYSAEHHAGMVLTPDLWSPMTWYVGKLSAIQEYIDPVRRPWLAAGDSPSDWWMLFHADAGAGGHRVWVNRKPAYTERLTVARRARAAAEAAAGLPDVADKNWIVVTPSEIGG
ncbi:phosphorylcholine phosphatase [soil metagenome]